MWAERRFIYKDPVRTASVTQTSQLMLYREIIAVCSQIHTKHINTQCGQNVEFVKVKPCGTYTNHCNLKRSTDNFPALRIYAIIAFSSPACPYVSRFFHYCLTTPSQCMCNDDVPHTVVFRTQKAAQLINNIHGNGWFINESTTAPHCHLSCAN